MTGGGDDDVVRHRIERRNLLSVDVVGHHLSVQIEAQRPVDRHQLVVLSDDGGVVDDVDGNEGHPGVGIEPVVEISRSEGKGGDRHAVEDALGVIRHLARLVQMHEAGGEHLRVHAVPATRSLRQRRGHDVGHGTHAVCKVLPSVTKARA